MTTRIDPATLPGRPCSIAAALELVGDRWSLLIMREVSFGNTRFSAIARNTGAPRDRLAARLRSLVDAGVLERRPCADAPHHDEYVATEAGLDLGTALNALLTWGDRWAVDRPQMRLHHHDHDLVPRLTCMTCGEPVGRESLIREPLTDGWDLTGPRGR